MLELLSPAGTPEAVIAAVQSGADSIYIRFGGAGSAGFSEDDFQKAVRYCRVRGCRVYAELDSSLWDDELPAAEALLRQSAEAGVSAMVVQDLGAARLFSLAAPGMPLHAGERLDLHDLAGVEAAAQLGFSRVRLPAELSLGDIARIAAHSTVELEAAVQDRLCFSRAGSCHLGAVSELRSADRGRCPGLCREKYSLGGRMDDERPLSLKDLCLLTHLRELSEAGVACVRIGPWNLSPELTALATGLYSRCIREERSPSPGEEEQLDFAYEHRRFTDGYLTGEREDMFGAPPPPEGDSRKVLAEARRSYESSEARRVPVEFFAVLRRGETVKAAARDGDGNRVVTEGPAPLSVPGRALSRRDVESALYKTGGTPYSCTAAHVMADPGLTLTEGALDELRRGLLRSLTEKRARPPAPQLRSLPDMSQDKGYYGKQAVIFEVMSASQLIPELAELGPDYVYVPLEALISDFEALSPFLAAGATPVAVLPRVITDGEAPGVLELLKRASALGVSQALAANLGHIPLARLAGMDLRGDAELDLANSRAMELMEGVGLLSVTVPTELHMERIKALRKPINTEMIVYGRTPVMLSEHCVVKKSAGRCVCGSGARLSDNKGAVYPILREYGCRNLFLSANKIFLADKREDLEFSGLWGLRLCFTTESARECVEVAKSYMGLSEYRPNGLTRGLYYRGVE